MDIVREEADEEEENINTCTSEEQSLFLDRASTLLAAAAQSRFVTRLEQAAFHSQARLPSPSRVPLRCFPIILHLERT